MVSSLTSGSEIGDKLTNCPIVSPQELTKMVENQMPSEETVITKEKTSVLLQSPGTFDENLSFLASWSWRFFSL